METNLEIEALRKKYDGLRANVYEYSGATEGTEDFEKFKKIVSDFEMEGAPNLDLFPGRDPSYWIIKTALVVSYAGFREYNNDTSRRWRFINNLLTTHGYSFEERKEIIKIINLKEKVKDKKGVGLEGKI
jgi:hypothetical protein